MQTFGPFALLTLLLVGACGSTSKLSVAESRRVQKVGVLVLGADSIQTAERSYRFPKPYYGRMIEKAVRAEFKTRGYDSLTLNPVHWHPHEQVAQMKFLSQKYQLSHFFIVQPLNKREGFALNSSAKGGQLSTRFKADFRDAQGIILSTAELTDVRALPGRRVAAVKAVFDRNPVAVKNASLDYYQKQLAQFSALVVKTGLVARASPLPKNGEVKRGIASVAKKKRPHLVAKKKPRVIKNAKR